MILKVAILFFFKLYYVFPSRGGGGEEANTNELIHSSHSVRCRGIAQLLCNDCIEILRI